MNPDDGLADVALNSQATFALPGFVSPHCAEDEAPSLPEFSVRSRTMPVRSDTRELQLRSCLQRIVLHDAKALADLYDATVDRVYAVALRLVKTREAAEEVVSDVYYQVWRDAARYDSGRAVVHTWLLLICRSRALDALRKQPQAGVKQRNEGNMSHAVNPVDAVSAGEISEEGLRSLLDRIRLRDATSLVRAKA